jgi:hypothetical protein
MTPAAERQILGHLLNPVPPHQGPCPSSTSRPSSEQSTRLALWYKLLSLLRVEPYELILCRVMALLYEIDVLATIDQGSVSRYLPFGYTSEGNE